MVSAPLSSQSTTSDTAPEQPTRNCLIVRLDTPSDGSTRFSAKIAVQGWLLLPEETPLSALEFTLLLRERSTPQSVLAAGLSVHGVALSGASAPARIEDLTFTELPGKLHDPSRLLRGRRVQFDALLDLSACAPELGGDPQMFGLVAVAALGEERCGSPETVFSIAPPEFREQSYGGFLFSLPAEIHAELLPVHGWAARHGAPLEKVAILINQRPIAEALVGIESGAQAAALPDIDTIAHSGFAKVLARSVVAQNIPPEELDQPVELCAICRFADGEELALRRLFMRWLPDPLGEAAAPFGRVECVGESSRRMLRIEGWCCIPGLQPQDLMLRWMRGEERFSLSEIRPDVLERVARPELLERYPTAVDSAHPGFRLQLTPAMFGAFPGAIKVGLTAADGGAECFFGPEAMSAVIEEERSRLMPLPRGAQLANALLRAAAPLALARTERRESPAHPPGGGPPRIIAASHNLAATEGAPKVLYEVLRAAREKLQAEILVISPIDGPLHASFASLGIEVVLMPGLSPVEQTSARYLESLKEAAARVRQFAPDLVYANVLDSYWAVDLARRLGVPSAWAIHESVAPERAHLDAEALLRYRFLHSLAYADLLLFVSEGTRQLFVDLRRGRPTQLIANGIEADRFAARRKQLSMTDARTAIGASPQAKVLSIVGTTAHRKGQDVFIQAAALLKKRLPAEELRFFIVGARESDYLTHLEEQSRALDLEQQLTFVPETPDPGHYFLASDIMSICSRQESAPLVSLEAMAYGVPLVSTTVFGLAEQLEHSNNAYCVPVEDPEALASAWQTLLIDEELRRRITRGGLESVSGRFSADTMREQYLTVIADLCRDARRVSA